MLKAVSQALKFNCTRALQSNLLAVGAEVSRLDDTVGGRIPLDDVESLH